MIDTDTLDNAEKEFLGELIQKGSEELARVSLQIGKSDFYFDEHRFIFEMLKSIDHDKKNICRDDILNYFGSYFEQQWEDYFKEEDAYDGRERTQSILEHLFELEPLNSITDNISIIKEFVLQNYKPDSDNSDEIKITPLSKAIEGALTEIQKEQNGEIFRYKTGFRRLDSIIRGLENGRLYVLGAWPKCGKSLFVGQLALNIARDKIPVGIISLEMTKTELAKRYLSMYSSVNTVTELNINELKKIKDELQHLPIMIYDKSLSVDQLPVVITKMVNENGARVIFIDYLGLIRGDGSAFSKTDEVTDAVRMAKQLAKKLNVPVFLVASLTIKQMMGKEPTAADFRDSGQIPYDADCIIFMWKKNLKDETYRELIIANSRYTRQMERVDLYFDQSKVTFSETLTLKVVAEELPPPEVKYFKNLEEALCGKGL